MKIVKNSLLAIAAFALLAPAFTGCKKVSKRKLNGDWDVTSGTAIISSTNSGGTSTTNITFDGSKETIVSSSGGITVTNVNDKTISYSFDKKAGTYTRVIVATTNETDKDRPYYTKDGSNYTLAGKYDRKTLAVSTTTEKGTFTITGGTGDIDKNSQIVFSTTSVVSDIAYTYTYYEEGTSVSISPSGKYEYDGNWTNPTYKELVASKNETSSSTGKNYISQVMNVESLKKGIMEVNYSETDSYVSGATSNSYSKEYKWTLTEK